MDLNSIAKQYVKLVLAVGRHDADSVDAYYGPPEWKLAGEAEALSLDAIRRRAHDLEGALQRAAPPAGAEDLDLLRHRYLGRHLASLVARVRMLEGEALSFDEESRALYDATAPARGDGYFDEVLSRLEARLPGTGPLVERYDAYRRAFIVPPPRLEAVFRAAIDECRRRTRDEIELPEGERLTVEYVTNKPWSGYNWYQGHYASVIQVNTDLPVHVDQALVLACHEGYPGHHVYNTLLEARLVRERGWMEYTVVPLFSPQSLVAEGMASFAIDVAFAGRGRLAYEQATLFPLAGLDPSKAAEYAESRVLIDELAYADNEAARRLLDGTMGAAAAVDWLMRYRLLTRPRAEQRLRFIERYRSYVINYNLGRDLVRAYIERHEGTADRPAFRWRQFEQLISSPRLPSELG